MNNESIQISVDITDNNNDWDSPQVNATETNCPKINEALRKAVNAAISINSRKKKVWLSRRENMKDQGTVTY